LGTVAQLWNAGAVAAIVRISALVLQKILSISAEDDSMKILLALAVSLFPSIALAVPITFDLRDPAIELIDEVNSFSLTQNGLIATLSANPPTFNEPPLRTLVLNQTSSSFGINVVNTTCGGLEESALIDGGCTKESVAVAFSKDVILNSLRVSSFGSSDVGLVTIGSTAINILSTGTHSLGNAFLLAETVWSLAFAAGNGFSFDNFTVTQVQAAEPAGLILLGVGLVTLVIGASRRQK
jgi:hypothetical protein